MTISPSTTQPAGSRSRSAACKSGKYRSKGLRSRLWMYTSLSLRKTMARKPSHLGSKRTSPSDGSSSAICASIGSMGGTMGKRMAHRRESSRPLSVKIGSDDEHADIDPQRGRAWPPFAPDTVRRGRHGRLARAVASPASKWVPWETPDLTAPPAPSIVSERDPYRRMVAGFVATAHLTVDPGTGQSSRQRRAQQQMVDAKPCIARVRVAKIVPERIDH